MKKILSIALSLILIFGASSCERWLDVNTNPNSPNSESATVELRLPWIQYYYAFSWGNASVRSNAITQVFTTTTNNLGQFDANNDASKLANWDPHQDVNLRTYQRWFTGAACNIPDLITKAQKEGATHYEAAALTIKSMGFIMMVDLMGDIPYSQALTADVSPSPDKGEDVYAGCLADLERAIELFSEPQAQGATLLSEGDLWCGGDASKWLKLCYALKARWLGNLSKTDQYDPDAVLDAISKAMQSNNDNVKMTHSNVPKGSDDPILPGGTYGNSIIWSNVSHNASLGSYDLSGTERLNRWYVDLLTNFKGSGVEDPRADKLLPHMMTNVVLSEDGNSIIDCDWRRDEGIYVQGIDEGWKISRYEGAAIRTLFTLATSDVKLSYKTEDINKFYVSVDAFVAAVEKYYPDAVIENTESSIDVTYLAGMMYCEIADPQYVEDIKYVSYASDNVADAWGVSETDMSCYYSNSDAQTRGMGYVQGTSTFYARPDSDTDIMTYYEMCFLKAEVLFRQGKKPEAYEAYINGIKAHFSRMNDRLKAWEGKGCCTTNFGFDVSMSYAPMAQADIDAYMKSAAVAQSASALTMSDIMMQKLIAMGFDYQNWNDMRRFNYYAGNIEDFGVIYTEMKEPVFRTCTNSEFDTDDQSDRFYVRRWQQCYYETDFNTTETLKFILENYGQYGVEGLYDNKIFSIPVWWDWTK